MKTGILNNNRKGSGFELKRLVAMLLVLIQCASLAFVGAPVAYAETEDPQDAVVEIHNGEPSQDPDEEVVIGDEDEDEPEPDPEPESGELEADLGDGFAVTLFYEADAGIPANASLEIRVPEVPPENMEDFDPAALYLSDDEYANYAERMYEALGVTDSDYVFGEPQLFELRILDEEGGIVIPACPVEICFRFPEADGTMAETFAAVSFDETAVPDADENTTSLGASGWSADEGCALCFDAQDFALFGVCSWAKEHLALRMGNYEISVFAPACAQLKDETLTFAPEEENLQLEEARSLHVSSDAPYGSTALWAVIRGDDAETNAALYSLIGTELCEHLHPAEDGDEPIELGEANGFALFTIDPDVPLYSDDTLTLTGEAPVGVVVEAKNVFDDYVDFDFASLTEPEPEPEPAPAPKPMLFNKKGALRPVMGVMTEMLTEAAQEQAASAAPKAEESRPWYELIGAYDITLSLDGGEYQPDAENPIEVKITDPAIDRDLDLQLWHIHGSRRERVDFSFDDSRDDTIVFMAESFSDYILFSVTKEQTLTTPDGETYLITVTYDASSGIPRDAILEVGEILPGDPGYDEYVARCAELLAQEPTALGLARPFDISLIDPETGDHCQPDKSVSVSITLLDENLEQYENLSIVHFAGEAADGATVMDAEVSGDSFSFKTDGFSVYVITGENAVPRRKYTFYYINESDHYLNPVIGDYTAYPFKDDKGNTVFSQIVKNGSELTVPQLSSVETAEGMAAFAGWYENVGTSSLELASQPYDFDNITITENDAVDLYAVYKLYAAVIFHNQYDSTSGTFPVDYTRRGELVTGTITDPVSGQPVDKLMTMVRIDDVTSTYTSSDATQMAFWGWSYKPISTPGSATNDDETPVEAITPDENGCIRIFEDTHLYPIFKVIHRLSFYSGPTGSGASYFPAKALFSEDGLATLHDHIPERDGYTFLGWYAGTLLPNGTIRLGSKITNADGSLVQSFDDGGVYSSEGRLMLRSDATLYAGWSGPQISYKVLIWKQRAEAQAGTPIEEKYDLVESYLRNAPPDSTVSVTDADKTLSALVDAGFVCGSFSPATPIDANGETVLHVYYDKSEGYTPPSEHTHTLVFKDSYDLGRTPFKSVSVEAGTDLSGSVPADPEHKEKGYSGQRVFSFNAWFADPLCSTQVFFSQESFDAYVGKNQKVLYSTMPDEDLTIYAGWKADWFLVQIDPNYGTFNGTGGTWFWETYDGELVREYTQVTRDYVESSSGNYYYIKHDRAYYGYSGSEFDNSEPDRDTSYTTNINEATEDKTFEYAPGNYTYAGWYEVLPDGSEVPYDFSRHVDHHLYLKLHWKKNGIYYLAYDAGSGKMENGTDTTAADSTEYADFSEVEMTRAALPPAGNTFLGWTVRGSDSHVIYTTGQRLILHAEDAMRIGGKDVIYLDAVYAPLGTASVIYDANGGHIAESGADFGFRYNSNNNKVPVGGNINGDYTAATVSGLQNNDRFKLSDGSGFSYVKNGVSFTLVGWSSSKAYDPDKDTLFELGGDYGVDKEEPTTLYAVWQTTVTYHLNNNTASWTSTDLADWGGNWAAPYSYDSGSNTWSRTVCLGSAMDEPPYIPQYTDGRVNPADQRSWMFFQWRTKSYDVGAAPDTPEADADKYDFSEPVTGPLDLYAYWAGEISVPVHALDASQTTITEVTAANGWTIRDIQAGTTPVNLPGNYVTAPDGEHYDLAFVAMHTRGDDLQSISRDEEITAIYYNQTAKQLYVRFADPAKDDAPLYNTHEIYYVFYRQKQLDIGYKLMPSSGALQSVTPDGAAPAATGLLGEYDMAAAVTAPRAWTNNDYPYYVYAIGAPNATSAAELTVLTETAETDEARPTLNIRNTWRGFQYATTAGENAVWTDCGYEPTLYVVYFTQQHTLFAFDVQTIALGAFMDTVFRIDLEVTQTETTTTSVQTQRLVNDIWENDGDPETTTVVGDPQVIYNHTMENYQPYLLRNGESNTAPLFYSSVSRTGEPVTVDETTRTVTTVTTVTAQTAELTQTVNGDFALELSSEYGTIPAETPNVWRYTSDGTGGTKNVTFTNTHKSVPVVAHVAVAEQEGADGILRRDSLRSGTETAYSFVLENGRTEELLTKLPAAGLFTGDRSVYAFGAIVLASGAEQDGDSLVIDTIGAASIAYEKVDGNRCELVIRDAEGNILGELGDKQLYYLYYPMSKIRFVKADSAGNLTPIRGCVPDAQTGVVELSERYVTYNYTIPNWNGDKTEQNRRFEIPLSGLVISQSSSNTRVPPILDDGTSEGFFARYLRYAMIGAGGNDINRIDNLTDKSDSLRMELRIQNNALQFDVGNGWKDLPLVGEPTVYFIFTERGYDLAIHKTVPLPAGEENNPVFTGKSFDVVISSDALKGREQYYDAEGAESARVEADTTEGTISLTVTDGTKIKIKGLPRGEYTITESGNENYTLTAKSGPIVTSTTNPDRPITVTDNKSVSVSLNRETKIQLTNSPKPLCRLVQTGDIFYTLRSAVAYVEAENISLADLEMLTDYLMPIEDTVEIPKNFKITLTTPTDADAPAVITRSEELKDVPLFTNLGELAFNTIVLDGNEIDATQPYIMSAGNLTIGDDAILKDVINGGAIKATAGDITVSGSIENCSAPQGGAVCHTGNGTVTLSGSGGKLSGNRATTGDGGAIFLTGGTIKLSGFATLSGNEAPNGRGGAIYVGSAVIDINQSAKLNANKAKAGGAIYAGSAAITVEASTGYTTPPSFTGNIATETDGGAIWVGTGSVSLSGGSLTNNAANAGKGGAVYAGSATVGVSGTADLSSNTAGKGAAVYAESGVVTVSGGSLTGNTASQDGGAIYAGSGNMTVSGGSLTGNTATSGNGGAIYAGSGNMTVSGGSVANNAATNGSGGAIYAGSGSVTVSGGSLNNNTAKTNGGGICALSGAVTIEKQGQSVAPVITENEAKDGKGGAVYAGTGAVTLTEIAVSKNKAGKDGGAICADSGNVTVSGGSMTENEAKTGNGGAISAGSGVVTVDSTGFTANKATGGKGGAISLDSGMLAMTTVTATGNSAVNGAAIFNNNGRAYFHGGSFTGNTADAGGAVGVGNKDARLYFDLNVQVKDNKLGTGDSAPKSNVYLDQDDDAVINIDGLGSSASIGVYVPDAVVDARSVPGARFAIYTVDTNYGKITNDRFPALTVQRDTAAKKLFWGNAIKVSVCYMSSFSDGFPPSSDPISIRYYTLDSYYPEFSDAAISELAAELFTKYGSNYKRNNTPMSATAVYAGAYLDDAGGFGEYLTNLSWNKNSSEWIVTRRDGTTVSMKKSAQDFRRIYIYYSEPAYLSIENNTKMTLKIEAMTAKNGRTSVINDAAGDYDILGYGMLFAEKGAVKSALLPVKLADLELTSGSSVKLLIPGGQGMPYTLSGKFTGDDLTTPVRLRRSGLEEESLEVNTESGSFATLEGTTLSSNDTYSIVFGDDKSICKVRWVPNTAVSPDDYSTSVPGVIARGEVEYTFVSISQALAFIQKYMSATKTATVEMLTDYLLPASDPVDIPQGYNITITTASTGVLRYVPVDPEEPRATISRDSLNTDSMIQSWKSLVNNKVVTTLRLSELVIDGKSVRGNSDGGAVASQYTNVYIDHVDFRNVYANNGGALLVMFNFDRRPDHTKDNKVTMAGTVLEVRDSVFTGCTSTTTVTSNRLGGGAVVTNAETMTMERCNYSDCTAVDQAGAVFHRVDGNYNSNSIVTDCTFTNCQANAAGGLELNAKTITVTGCTFNHCQAKERNGGGFNVWAINTQEPTADCWVTVTDCTFNDCQVTDTKSTGGNGGGFRSNAVYTTVENCSFTNNTGYYGGGFCVSNSKAIKAEIYGSSFERNTANQGGGVLVKAKEVIIGDYTYTDETGEHTRHTEIKNCISKKEGGGGICHDRDVNGSSLTITNAVISGNEAQNTSKNGGGVFTNARTVTVSGASFTDNTCTGSGGGIYAYTYTSMKVEDSVISRNIATGSGGGIWLDANNDTNREALTLTVKGSTFDGNTCGGNGGGIYTLARTVTVGASETKKDENNKPIPTTISNCVSVGSGGGIYQNRRTEYSSFTMCDSVVTGCKATKSDANGGGVYTNALTARVEGSTFSHNSTPRDGGGLYNQYWSSNNPMTKSLTILGCTFDDNSAGNNGGGVSTCAKELTIGGLGEGENMIRSSFKDCKANGSGGGIQYNNSTDSTMTVRDCTIENCHAYTSGSDGGGGIVSNAGTASLTRVTLRGNTSGYNGGGILYSRYRALTVADDNTGPTQEEANPETGGLRIDNCELVGNTAGNSGGGAYSKSFVMLRHNSSIHGNILSGSSRNNAAGLYLENNMTLVVGTLGEEKDGSSIYDNETTAGEASNLRLWWNNNSNENHGRSVYVNCPLNGEIRVVNADKVGTKFGTSAGADFDGFADDKPVFRADHSTLHGIYHRTIVPKTTIIWAGPPIARITGVDADGNEVLLYMKDNGSDPAIFDRLDDGSNDYNKISAFSILRSETPELYTADGTLYSGKEYRVRMLVPEFTTEKRMMTKTYPGRKIVFNTADPDDPYREEGRWTRSTVTRGTGVGNYALLYANVDFELENLILDGNDKTVSANTNTRILDINNVNARVTLGVDAILQNATINGGGGGVIVTNGTFVIAGGTIRDCTAVNGGAIYLTNTGSHAALEAGNITRCTATGNGGGVFIKTGSFSMSGGTISAGSADAGGGVYVNSSNFYMSGGTITNNHAASKGGGVAFGGSASAKIWFAKNLKVNISGNTSDTSVATNQACNVEMDHNSNAVINTHNGGLMPGSYIGVYVPGDRDDENPNNESDPYKSHGGKKDPFGTFVTGDNTATLYSFVNDRNGLKGGIIENPQPNTIYWIEIFALRVQKEVVYSPSLANSPLNPQMNPEETFSFTVRIWGTPSIGQPGPDRIDSDYGDFGEMIFDSDGMTATAEFTLADGEAVMGVNLSEGLDYSVIENLTPEQSLRYAVLPTATFTRTKGIGENKGRTDVDPYVSSVVITNVLPVCKITTDDGQLLYRKYTVYQRDANGDYLLDENGNKVPLLDHQGNPVVYDVPAVFTELTGEDGAFRALEKDTFKLEGATSSYSVTNGVQIQMLIPNYTLTEPVVVPELQSIDDSGRVTVTLTTASAEPKDGKFPYQGTGTTSTIVRGYDGNSMFTVNGAADSTLILALDNIILDGAKGDYTANDGGIVYVGDHGELTITNGAALQNARSVGKGGAVYVAAGGTVTMTDTQEVGGKIQRNESTGDGAGIYLESGSKLVLSGDPYLGGRGTNAAGTIIPGDGNYRTSLTFPAGTKNGGKEYTTARQDIFLAEANGDEPQSIVIDGDLTAADGTIWVWAENNDTNNVDKDHYKTLRPFAKLADGVEGGNLMVFRNARPDEDTDNDTDTYLFGELNDDHPGYVCWSGVKGSRRVILRKVKGTDEVSLKGAKFTVYKGDSVYKPTDEDPLEGLVSDENGVFWVGDLPYGIYYIHETYPNDRWFYLIVYDSEPEIAYPNPYIKGPYQFKTDAAAAGITMNSEIKQAQDQARQNG